MSCTAARACAGITLVLPVILAATSPPALADADVAAVAPALESIEVDAQRLDEARTGIQTQVGASVYTIDAAAIAAMPGGDNGLLNQAIMQAPDVAQDSFGQFHVRGEHNGLQYRLNGIVLPEGISGFGQALDPRLIASMQLITGALPAEYGLRTAGIIDLSTKSGALDPGGSVSLYGGSHGTVQPSIDYGGAAGRWQYFGAADALGNDLGIESPDRRSTPLHDRSKQYHLFAYLENVVDGDNRVSLITAASHGGFQIPDHGARQPDEGYVVNGQSAFSSGTLDETQSEQTEFAIASWQHAHDALDLQTAVTLRNSALQFTPDPLGDLLFNGIAQNADKRNVAGDWQTDAAYTLGGRHTLRAGLFVQVDRSISNTSALVLPVLPGQPPGQTPERIIDNGARTERIGSAYLQDEWRIGSALTANYGLRFDAFSAYTSDRQLSPRVNLVWTPRPATTVHAGYARYFSPPPFELVGTETVAKFLNTTAAPDARRSDPPQAERANYFDLGVLQRITRRLSVGVDAYYKHAAQLIDEGQFGAPIILTPFNYQTGRQTGAELTVNYAGAALSSYANLSWQRAQGRRITSAQFNFTPDTLRYIAENSIPLDHQQKFSASGGLSYRHGDTRWSADLLAGSGLRASLTLPDGTAIPNGRHLPAYTQINAGCSHDYHLAAAGTLTARLDIINVFDRVYEIRDGTGVGVGAPQYGARRGYFVGLSKSL